VRNATIPTPSPALRHEVRVSGPRYRDARTVRVVHDARSGRCYEFGPKEAFLTEKLSKGEDFEKIGQDYAATFAKRLAPASWGQFLGLLRSRDLLEPVADMPNATVASRAETEVRASDWRTGRWVVAPVSAVVPRLYRWVQVLCSAWLAVPLVLVVAALMVWLTRTLLQEPQVMERMTDWRVASVVGIGTWISLSLHELGHGVAAQHFGGSASEVGVLFRPPTIFLYCRVDAGGYVTSRRAQVLVALAGTWVNLLALLPLWLWYGLDDDRSRRELIVVAMVAGALTGLINLVPIPPADGFKALSAALGHLDLSRDSRACVLATARTLLGRPATAYGLRLRLVYLSVFLLTVTVYAAVLAAVLWYCLAILPREVGALVLAAALAYVVGVGASRVTRSSATASSKGQS
jgi:putative peptide zinc metalloprotease protein